jgi:Rrf2 family iron-sulfur cluster assembly transcriptional regulator
MLDLALHGESAPVSLADISSRQAISLSYLEQLFAKLRRHGLVASVRGPGGGYRLSRPLDDIYTSEIIDAVNESVDATLCGGNANCLDGHVCPTHFLWTDLSEQIHRFLGSISLASLVERPEVQAISRRQDADGSRRRAAASDRIPALDQASLEPGAS